MSRQLRVALYLEGKTDQRFLPAIVRRTILEILATRGQSRIELLDPEVIKPEPEPYQDNARAIFEAAKMASGYDALIVHKDIDKRTRQTTLEQLLQPGLSLIQQALQQPTVVPL